MGHDRLDILEPVVPPEVGISSRGADDARRDEVTYRLGVGVAELGHAIADIVLLAVLYPDLLASHLSNNRDFLHEVQVVVLQAVDVFRVAGKLVVVVAGHDRDRYLLARFPELLEETRLLLDQRLQLLRALERGELPQPEGITVDDQLDVLLVFERLEEIDQLCFEVAVLELTVAPDVHVADKEVFLWHRAYPFPFCRSRSSRLRASSMADSVLSAMPGSPSLHARDEVSLACISHILVHTSTSAFFR